MLQKANRLTKNKEFDSVFKDGRSNYSKIIGVKMAPNETGLIRMGVLVGNKISKKATERNKIKRRIRDVFRAEMDKLIPGRDFVVIALQGVMEKGFDEIKPDLISCLKRLNAYKKDV